MSDKTLYIAILSGDDCGNSGHKLMHALNKYVNCKARCIVARGAPSAYPYKRDIIVEGNPQNRKLATQVINEADIIHIKGDQVIEAKFLGIPLPKNKPIIVTRSGSIYRRNYRKIYRGDLKLSRIRTAFMADLAFADTDVIFIPHPIDTNDLVPLPLEKRSGVLTISHSPTNRRAKRTELIQRAIAGIPNIRLDIIQKVKYNECLRRKGLAHIFYDRIQQGVGSYGNSAIEACALGLATISYISDQARNVKPEMLGVNNCPILSTNPNGLRQIVQKLVNEHELRKSLMQKCREWAVKWHSSEVVAKKFDELYRKMV